MPAAGPAVAAAPAAADDAPVEVRTSLCPHLTLPASRLLILYASVGKAQGENYLQRQA